MSGVLRGFSSAEYDLYASMKTLVRPCSSKKLLISELDTRQCPFDFVDGQYSGSHKYVPIGRNRGVAEGFGERRPTAISCSTIRKATEGIVGRSEASPLPPDALPLLARHRDWSKRGVFHRSYPLKGWEGAHPGG